MLNKQINPYSLCISCRYGKFFVLDLLDVDGLWAGVEEKMNMVQKELLTSLMDKSLFKENKSVGTGHVHSTLIINIVFALQNPVTNKGVRWRGVLC